MENGFHACAIENQNAANERQQPPGKEKDYGKSLQDAASVHGEGGPGKAVMFLDL